MSKLTNWHLDEVRKPEENERVLVVRKAWFSPEWYIDIARFDGAKYRCGGAVITVKYWHEMPMLPEEGDVRDEHR